MDVNTTVAVNIMIRTSMGAAQREFQSGLNRMAGDARDWSAKMNNTFANAFKSGTFRSAGQQAGQAFQSGFQSGSGGGGTGGGGKSSGGHFGFFQQMFGANILAGITMKGLETAKEVVTSIAQMGESAVEEGAKFERFSKSIEVFAGSAHNAAAEISGLDAEARKTPGLRLESAELGYQRLRALNFEARLAKDLVTGIGKQRLISGADEANVQRVIVNFTQLARSTARTGMDLREIVHAIPTMSGAFAAAFGTVDPGAIKKLIDSNPNKFFTDLAKAMNETKLAGAGLSVTFEKFQDSWLEAQRAFSGPLLEPLSHFFTTATELIYQNLGNFRSWGSSIAEDVRLIEDAFKNGDWGRVGMTVAERLVQGIGGGLGVLTKVLGQGLAHLIADTLKDPSWFTKDLLGGFIVGITGNPDNTANISRVDTANRAAMFLNDQQSGQRTTGAPTTFEEIFKNSTLTREENQLIWDRAKKNLEDIKKGVKDLPSVADAVQADKAAQDTMKLLEAQRKYALSIAQNDFNITQARIALNPILGPSDTIANANATLQAQNTLINQQIREQKKGYEAELVLAGDDVKKREPIRIHEQEAIKNLNAQRTVNELTNQKTIQDAERSFYDTRRQALTEFQGLTLRGTQQHYAELVKEIERGMSRGTVTFEEGLVRQYDIENQSYNAELQLLRAQLAIQLQDRRLTNEQIINLKTTEQHNEIERGSRHNDQMFQLEQTRVDRERKLLEDSSQRTIETVNSTSKYISNGLDAIFGDNSTTGRSSAMFNAIKSVYDTEIADIDRSLRQAQEVLTRVPQAQQDRSIPTPVTSQPAGLAPIRIITGGQPFNADPLPSIIDVTTGQPLTLGQRSYNDRPTQGVQQSAISNTMSDLGKTYLSPRDVAGMMQQQQQQQQQVQVPITPPDNSQLQATVDVQHNVINDQIDYFNEARQTLTDFFKGVQSAYDSFTATAQGVDAFEKTKLTLIQDAETKALDIQVITQDKITLLATEGYQKTVEQAKGQVLLNEARVLGNKHLAEEEKLYRESIVGLTEYNAALAAGDKIATAYAENKAIKSRLKEESGLREQIISLNDRISNSNTINALEIETAALQSILTMRHKETETIIATNQAQIQLADATVYHADQANLKVLQFLASQKGVTDIMADFKIGVMNSAYDVIDKGLDRIIPKMGLLHDVIKNMISSFIKLALNSAFRKMFGMEGGGLPGVSGTGGGSTGGGIMQAFTGGGSFGLGGFGGGNGGNASAGLRGFGGWSGLGTPQQTGTGGSPFGGFGSIFGQGMGVGGAPTAVDSSIPIFGNMNTGQMPGAPGSPGARTGIGGMFAGFGANIAGALPGLGLSFGALAGRGSGIGQILGGAGGLVLGGMGAAALLGTTTGIFAAGGSLSMLAPLLTNPFTAIAAGGVIALALWLGHKAKVNREKKQAEQGSTDAVAKIQQLIADVKSFKIDGTSAYQQGVQIRDAFQQSISKFSTGTGKRLAQQKLGDINSLLATLKVEGDKADRAKMIAQATDEALVPTFATGGFTGLNYGITPAVLHSNEVVLNQANVMALGGYRALQNAGVRGINMSGAPDRYERPISQTSRGTGGDRPIYVIAAFSEEHADSMFDMVSPYGLAKKVKVASRKDLAGMNDMLADKLAGN